MKRGIAPVLQQNGMEVDCAFVGRVHLCAQNVQINKGGYAAKVVQLLPPSHLVFLVAGADGVLGAYDVADMAHGVGRIAAAHEGQRGGGKLPLMLGLAALAVG